MRIIAGSARGTPLLAPKGMDTRPTQDKVKESLFNMLQGQLEDGAALDLFAGSGALGLEAVSRGASRAVLVDQSREAAQCIRRNIEKLRFQDRAELLTCDWKQAVSKLAREGASVRRAGRGWVAEPGGRRGVGTPHRHEKRAISGVCTDETARLWGHGNASVPL